MLENHVSEVKSEWVVCEKCNGLGEVYSFKSNHDLINYLEKNGVKDFSEAMFYVRKYQKTGVIDCLYCGGLKGYEARS